MTRMIGQMVGMLPHPIECHLAVGHTFYTEHVTYLWLSTPDQNLFKMKTILSSTNQDYSLHNTRVMMMYFFHLFSCR